METAISECPICYQEFTEKCTTQCQHSFCKKCIIQVLLADNSSCPYCRDDISPYSLKLENGDPLLVQPTTIFGEVYIQGDTEGLASYHFNSPDDCYISYESPDCSDWPDLSDGSRPPMKKPFENAVYSEDTRTFSGIINWSPINWKEDAMWVYTMVFSEDFSCIPHGAVVCFNDEKKVTKTWLFDQDLGYKIIGKDLKSLL